MVIIMILLLILYNCYEITAACHKHKKALVVHSLIMHIIILKHEDNI